MLAPLAVHARHGWQLLPDGGTPLRQQPADRDHRAWERFVARYAELQRAVSPRTPEMLILGVPDHRPPADLAEYGDRIGGWAAELLEPFPPC